MQNYVEIRQDTIRVRNFAPAFFMNLLGHFEIYAFGNITIGNKISHNSY